MTQSNPRLIMTETSHTPTTPEPPSPAPSRKTGDETSLSGQAYIQQPKGEQGGKDGPEPTRYGDWEVGGRCTDF